MTERTALYRLYDTDDQLIYVGVTQDPKVRFRQHRADKSWWPEVAMKDVEWFADSTSALAEERKLIQGELPRYNERGMPWRPELGDRPADSIGMVGLTSDPHSVVKHVLETGEPVVVTRHGRPILVLSPYPHVDQIAKGK